MTSCPACQAAVEPEQPHCGHCAAPLSWRAHCNGCGGVLERHAACGSVSYFCPACNQLVSRRTLVWQVSATRC